MQYRPVPEDGAGEGYEALRRCDPIALRAQIESLATRDTLRKGYREVARFHSKAVGARTEATTQCGLPLLLFRDSARDTAAAGSYCRSFRPPLALILLCCAA